LCVVVVVAGVVELGLFVVGVEVELLPPHPATATVAASVATSVSMAVSGVLLIGRAPVVIDVRGVRALTLPGVPRRYGSRLRCR
jgi:hypothetical protein